MARWVVVSALLLWPGFALAAGGTGHIERVDVDISNQAALQRGAKFYANYSDDQCR